jgi:hypothetical protein
MVVFVDDFKAREFIGPRPLPQALVKEIKATDPPVVQCALIGRISELMNNFSPRHGSFYRFIQFGLSCARARWLARQAHEYRKDYQEDSDLRFQL